MTKPELKNYFDLNAEHVNKWHRRNRYYYNDLKSFIKFNVEEGSRVLEVGSGTGELLNSINPSKGVGIDLSMAAINIARARFPGIEFYQADIDQEINFSETFDYVIISDLIGSLEDVQKSFINIKKVCQARTRIIVNQYNNLWWPILKMGELLSIKTKQPYYNWLDGAAVKNCFDLAGYEVIKHGHRLLFPKYFPIISWFFNKILANLPLIKELCLIEYFILRLKQNGVDKEYSVSVIIPARNEKGNIENAVKRIPKIGGHTEIIFVEGNSTDDTLAEIKRVADAYKNIKDVKYCIQDGKGKYNAVRKGFDLASGEILMILDADLTVPPEDLSRFYEVMRSGQAEYVQGTRLIYPMESGAMRFLNYLGNKFFSLAFSWLLEQYITDTLCGTKVLFKSDYKKIEKGRKFFGDFDPFGDFDLVFGASKLNLKMIELPIHYKERKYGRTNISRFKHGLILLKMLMVGIKKFKLNLK